MSDETMQPPISNEFVAKGCEQFADSKIEQEIVARGLTAPRIMPGDIQALMDKIEYLTEQPSNTTSTFVHAFLDGKFLLATGHSACVTPENSNAGIGIKIAKAAAESKAREKLWELEGYRLYAGMKTVVESIPASEYF